MHIHAELAYTSYSPYAINKIYQYQLELAELCTVAAGAGRHPARAGTAGARSSTGLLYLLLVRAPNTHLSNAMIARCSIAHRRPLHQQAAASRAAPPASAAAHAFDGVWVGSRAYGFWEASCDGRFGDAGSGTTRRARCL